VQTKHRLHAKHLKGGGSSTFIPLFPRASAACRGGGLDHQMAIFSALGVGSRPGLKSRRRPGRCCRGSRRAQISSASRRTLWPPPSQEHWEFSTCMCVRSPTNIAMSCRRVAWRPCVGDRLLAIMEWLWRRLDANQVRSSGAASRGSPELKPTGK
jgi:hypothetical protein